jgi:membrane associated rhomboid family serine protease
MTPAAVGFQCPVCVREGRASVRAPKRTTGLRTASRRWGPVTLSLIAVNVALFVATAISAGLAGNSPLDNYASPLWRSLAQVPVLVELGDYWRVVTAAFVHVGLLHLALNMLALLVFGSELERGLGRWRFGAVYAVSVLGGAAAIQMFGNPGQPVGGASTAIYGLLGALAVFMVVRRQDVRGIVTLLVINIVISFLPGISLLGHLGGLVAGAAAAGVTVALRRRPPLQIAALTVLGLVLLGVALTVQTVAVLGF